VSNVILLIHFIVSKSGRNERQEEDDETPESGWLFDVSLLIIKLPASAHDILVKLLRTTNQYGGNHGGMSMRVDKEREDVIRGAEGATRERARLKGIRRGEVALINYPERQRRE
jgi:hypothetical protein